MSQTAALQLDQVIAKTENFIESQIDDETILMHLDEGSFSSLKSSGQAIWAALDTPQSIRAVCDGLLEQFEVDEQQCQEQTLGFLSDLYAKGLVEIRG